MFDLVIKNGLIFDGSGMSEFISDIGINDGKITAVEKLDQATAKTTIDAFGYSVTPGFIDIHRHGDAAAFRPGYGQAELAEGLTTVINGACGLSVAPFDNTHKEEIIHYLTPITGSFGSEVPTSSMEAYLDALEKCSLPINVGMMVGAGICRAGHFGYTDTFPNDIRKIHKSIEDSLQAGAYAVSLGLGYAPECFYDTQGLISALAPIRNTNIPIAVHMREEGDKVCNALSEMIEVATSLHCPLHISHLKACGMRNWHKKIPQALHLMQQARLEGLDISCDVYPYEAGSTQLIHVLPPEFLTGGTETITARLSDSVWIERLKERIATGHDFDNFVQMVGWKNIMISALQLPQYQQYLGKNIEEIAESMHMDPTECACKILADEHCAVTMIDTITCEEDISMALCDPYTSLISDATYPTTGNPHPRVYASVTHFLEHYIGKKHIMPLSEAIRKLTLLPAQSLRLKNTGAIKEGFAADLCVFKPEELHANATYQIPRQHSDGMHAVIVHGNLAYDDGAFLSSNDGCVLRRA